MKALLSTVVGGPDTLTVAELPSPEPGPGEVRLAVKAAGVNFPDVLIIEDKYQFKPERPFSPGGEVAGVVDAVGPGVKSVAVGDRVIGSLLAGGMAEQVVLAEGQCTPMPDGMPFDEAAAMLLTYGTSYHALVDRAALQPGERLLVLGAAGGVGIAAVEIGVALGANVIAAASSQEKVDFAMSCGAQQGIVYPERLDPSDRTAARAFTDQLKAIGGGGVDVVYDAVGGAYAEPSLRALDWEGRFLVVGFPAGIPAIPLNLTLLKGCQIVGVFWGMFTMREPARNRANIAELFRLYGDGKVKPRVSARYPLERAAEAISVLGDRKAMGKVVVTME